jgi:hypothetical protein
MKWNGNDFKVWEVKRVIHGTKSSISRYNANHHVGLELCGPYVVALLNPLLSMRVSWALLKRETVVEPRCVFLQASPLNMEYFLERFKKILVQVPVRIRTRASISTYYLVCKRTMF